MNQTGMNFAVVANPQSANGRTGKRLGALQRAIQDAIGGFSLLVTQYPGHATELTRQALESGHDRIVCLGGDGTLYEILNGFFDGPRPLNPAASLAVLPGGTASDFNRTIGTYSRRDAIAALPSPHTMLIDVGRITYTRAIGEAPPASPQTAPASPQTATGYFVNCAHIGSGGAVVERVNRTSKAGGGFLSFLWGVAATLATYRNTRIELTIDGDRFEQVCNNIIIAKGRYDGGGMLVAPEAALDSGTFEVYVVGDVGRFDAFANLPRLYRGTLARRTDMVKHFKASRIEARLPSSPRPSAHTAQAASTGTVLGASPRPREDTSSPRPRADAPSPRSRGDTGGETHSATRLADPVLLSIEGEQPGQLPVTIELLPRALRLVVPQGPDR